MEARSGWQRSGCNAVLCFYLFVPLILGHGSVPALHAYISPPSIKFLNPVNPVILSKTLYSYDALGEAVVLTQDIDLDGQIDDAGPDVVSSNATAYVQLGSAWWRESRRYAFPDTGSAAALLVSTSRQRLSGLGGAYSADGASGVLVAESVSIDGRDNPSTSRTVVDRAAATVYQIAHAPDSTIAALSVTVNGLLQTKRSNHGLTSSYFYDALGRMVAVEDARGGVYSCGYDEHGRVVWKSDPATNGTWYAYDALGRQVAVTNALGHVIETAYDAEGHALATWGATYPVAYEYDSFGRMTSMYTYRGSEEIATQSQITNLKSQMDRTRWLYEEASGVLTNKVYADGKGPRYTYTPDGKLATRTWARGSVASYAYDASGQLTGIDYSDSTPDVSFTYDRLGRMTSAIVAGVSTNTYAYDPETLALSVETQNGVVIDRATDSLGRATGFSVAGVGDPGSPYAVSYGYDTYGRFSQVSNFQFQVSYSYLSGSSLISGMTASTGHAWTRSYEPQRNLIAAVENTYGETVISRFDYVNDAIGRRTSRADSGQAFTNPGFDVYSYNDRSEVVGAQRYHGTNPADTSQPFGGRGFSYDYDPIGNRLSASETVGGETLTKEYTANALNQYTAIANPDAVGLRGSATNTATVTVNGSAALSDNIASDTVPWHFALQADNANEGKYTFASIMAVVNPPGTNTPDIVSTASGCVYAPPQAETLTYDDDGNLLSDGRWQYAWNGENRLVKAEEQVCPTNRTLRKVEYAYDHQGRMVWKAVSHRATEAQSWEAEKSIDYLWDRFNIIAETTVAGSVTNTTYNVWGLDIDGSMQGVGGVGGLLAVVKGSFTYAPTYDGNGNIMDYVSPDGTIVAHREYDPFGGTVVATSDANVFTHWFSTKPWCNVAGLSEYQYRKYSPVLGRWTKRDPIGELGGLPLYAMCKNGLISSIDSLGESWESTEASLRHIFTDLGWFYSEVMDATTYDFPVTLSHPDNVVTIGVVSKAICGEYGTTATLVSSLKYKCVCTSSGGYSPKIGFAVTTRSFIQDKKSNAWNDDSFRPSDPRVQDWKNSSRSKRISMTITHEERHRKHAHDNFKIMSRNLVRFETNVYSEHSSCIQATMDALVKERDAFRNRENYSSQLVEAGKL